MSRYFFGKFTSFLFLASLLFAGSASADPTLVVDSGGQLVGATEVNVNGTAYDVTFVDGTCTEVFDGCDTAAKFTFQSQTEADQASQALLDTVFLDGATGNFDSDPTLTAGCSNIVCAVVTPWGLSGTDVVLSGANNWVDELSDGVSGYQRDPLQTTTPIDTLVHSVWTITGTEVVPEPASAGPAGVVNGIQTWLRADSGISSADGASVFSWLDQSGQENSAIWNSLNNFGETPPTYDETNPGAAGQPTVRFNGLDNALELDLNSLAGSDYTIFVVNARDGSNLANFYIAGDSFAANRNLTLGYENITTLRQAHFNNDLDATVEPYSGTPLWAIDTFRFEQQTGRQLYQDGLFLNADANSVPLISNTGTTLGHFRAFGSFYWFRGDLAEVVVYDRALSDEERRLVESELAGRYGRSYDFDLDGVDDSADFCPATPVGDLTDANGCSEGEFVGVARDKIQDLIDDPGTGSKAQDKLGKAQDKLDDAWAELAQGDDVKKGLKKIGDAAKELLKAEKEGVNVSDLIGQLVAFAEARAQDAIDAAIIADGDSKKIAKAQKELNKAEGELAKGKPDKAIDHYAKAWDEAKKA
jgi:hypothetical protein